MFHPADAEQSSHDETNTAEIIDQMFEEVLDYAGRMEHEEANNGDKEDVDVESEKERSEEGEAKEEEYDESNGDELLTFPSSGILSPLSKSVEAVVTPLVRLLHETLSRLYMKRSVEIMYLRNC